ncbi:hypothetical protein VTI74DRAFT_11292 [Chaetomium olivicolor]
MHPRHDTCLGTDVGLARARTIPWRSLRSGTSTSQCQPSPSGCGRRIRLGSFREGETRIAPDDNPLPCISVRASAGQRRTVRIGELGKCKNGPRFRPIRANSRTTPGFRLLRSPVVRLPPRNGMPERVPRGAGTHTIPSSCGLQGPASERATNWTRPQPPVQQDPAGEVLRASLQRASSH